jgi:hypothetical protein
MDQPGLKIAPAAQRLGNAMVLGWPFSCFGRDQQDHEQLLKNSQDACLEAFQRPQIPSFVAKFCSNQGMEAGFRPTVIASLPFSTVAHGPRDHDRLRNIVAPAPRWCSIASGPGLFSDQAGTSLLKKAPAE